MAPRYITTEAVFLLVLLASLTLFAIITPTAASFRLADIIRGITRYIGQENLWGNFGTRFDFIPSSLRRSTTLCIGTEAQSLGLQ